MIKFLRLIFKTSTLVFFVISLAVLNVLTLINSGIHDFLYKGLSALHISQLSADSPTSKRNQLLKEKNKLSSDLKKNRTKTAQLANKHKAELNSMKKRVKGLTGKITTRTVRNVSINMASIPAEAIPWAGAGVVLAVTAIDIHDACNSMKDMNEMMNTLDLNEYKNEADTVCGHKVNFSEEYFAMHKNFGDYIQHLKEELLTR